MDGKVVASNANTGSDSELEVVPGNHASDSRVNKGGSKLVTGVEYYPTAMFSGGSKNEK